MNQKQNRFIALHYQLYTVENGEKVLQEQTSREHPFQFITGFGLALDPLEQQVVGMDKGNTFELNVQPEQAFGSYVAEGVHKLDRDVFCVNGKFDSDNIFEGAVITLSDAEGNHFMARVTKIEDDGITVDTNHPLAGKVLCFEGEIMENREATQEEITKMIKQLTGDHHCCGGHCHDGQGGCQGGCGDGGCCGE